MPPPETAELPLSVLLATCSDPICNRDAAAADFCRISGDRAIHNSYTAITSADAAARDSRVAANRAIDDAHT